MNRKARRRGLCVPPHPGIVPPPTADERRPASTTLRRGGALLRPYPGDIRKKGGAEPLPYNQNPNPPATNKTVPITPPQKAGHAGPALRRNGPSLRRAGPMCPAKPVAAHRQPRLQGTRPRQPSVGAGLCSALTSAKYGKREEQSPSPTTSFRVAYP